MKSHVTSLLHILEGILKDVRRAYPEYQGVDLDFKRLTLLVKNRGLGVFTLDLPRLDELLLQGLETGLLPSKGFLRTSKKCKVPVLLRGLWLRIFDEDLCLKPNVDVNSIAFLRQIFCLGKKTEVPCSQSRQDAAIKDYIHVESILPKPSLRWELDELDPAGDGFRLHLCDRLVTNLPLFPEQSGDRFRKQALLSRCQQVADIVSRELGFFCAYTFSERRIAESRAPGLKHGPGAVSDRKGKFDKNEFINWSDKLQSVFPFELFGKMPNDPKERPQNHEVPSELILVPKTAKGPRIIAAEPTEHQWCQQVTRAMLEDSIRSCFVGRSIDFRRQDLSQLMVTSASRTRSHATVDLSSASDRLSCFVVERVFRRNPSLLAHLHAARTRYLKIPMMDNYHLRLSKFASQGTAVTFPIQSIVFYILAVSAMMPHGNITREMVRKYGNQIRVFGDDIIIPSAGYERLVETLHMLDLKVNESKSFVNGSFRESCGMDSYMGYDVTPVKPKTTVFDGPASCLAVLDTSNNLYLKGYYHAAEQLKVRLDRDSSTRFPIVGRDAVAKGFVSRTIRTAGTDYVELLRQIRNMFPGRTPERRSQKIHIFGRQYRVRYNDAYQRYECFTTGFSQKSRTRDRTCGYSTLLAFSTRERSLEFDFRRPDSELVDRVLLRKGKRWEPLENLFSREVKGF